MPDRLKPLAPYLRRYWKLFAWGGVSLILYNTVKVLLPIVIGHAIDDLKTEVTQQKIVFHVLRLLAVSVLMGIFLYAMRQIIIGASREIEFDLRNDLFANLERQSAAFYQTHRTGDIMARSTNDLSAVRQLLGPAIMYSANTVFFMAFALPFMFKISPKLTFFAFVPLPLASIVVQAFGARIHKRFERIQAMFSDISAKAQENFSGARLIRAFAQEEAEVASFETANQEYISRSLHLVRLMAMLWPALEFILGLSLMITLLVGGHEVVAHRITVGEFTEFMVYMVQLTWPLIAIGWVVNLFQRGTASLTRIDELLKAEPTIADESATHPIANVRPSPSNIRHLSANVRHSERSSEPPYFAGSTTTPGAPSSTDGLIGGQGGGPDGRSSSVGVERGISGEAESHSSNPVTSSPLLSFRTLSERKDEESAAAFQPSIIQGTIEFRNLTFAYTNGPNVLTGINLTIPAGSSLAIVGPTGSGKSTLINLIPRIYDAPAGTVLIDNHPIRTLPLDTLRAAIGFVPQETFLFSDSIHRNIAFGAPEATPDQIQQAAEIAHIRTEILEFPKGFETLVGERGVTLSGGQKQRTAIARAVIRDPRILILDDALASVDTYTEEQILSGLRTVMQDRTTILISHRISTARNADQIAVLVAGRIAEVGTHDELLSLSGYYAKLYEKQQLEEKLAVAV